MNEESRGGGSFRVSCVHSTPTMRTMTTRSALDLLYEVLNDRDCEITPQSRIALDTIATSRSNKNCERLGVNIVDDASTVHEIPTTMLAPAAHRRIHVDKQSGVFICVC
jgi:hypothetical protein